MRYHFLQEIGATSKLTKIQKVYAFLKLLIKYIHFAEDGTLKYRTDDEVLMIFLRPCKFYAQSAFELVRDIMDHEILNQSNTYENSGKN